MDGLGMLKSSRHSKITGDFAEAVVLYWLSKYWFECAKLDHTGIDLLARNPRTAELMGISVKSRSWSPGKGRDAVSIPNTDFPKVKAACDAFGGLIPYFAIVVDAENLICAYLLSMERLLELHPMGDRNCDWSMGPKWLDRYADDPSIKRFSSATSTDVWW